MTSRMPRASSQTIDPDSSKPRRRSGKRDSSPAPAAGDARDHVTLPTREDNRKHVVCPSLDIKGRKIHIVGIFWGLLAVVYVLRELRLLSGPKHWGWSQLERISFAVNPWYDLERHACDLNWPKEELLPLFLARFGACGTRLPRELLELNSFPSPKEAHGRSATASLVLSAMEQGLCSIDPKVSATYCSIAFACDDIALADPIVKSALYEDRRQSVRLLVFISRSSESCRETFERPSLSLTANETLVVLESNHVIRCQVKGKEDNAKVIFEGDLLDQKGALLSLSSTTVGSCTSAKQYPSRFRWLSKTNELPETVEYSVGLAMSPISRVSRGDFLMSFVQRVLRSVVSDISKRPKLEMDLQSSKFYSDLKPNDVPSDGCYKLAMQRKFDLNDVTAFVDGKLMAVINSVKDIGWFAHGLNQQDELVFDEVRERAFPKLRKIVLLNEQLDKQSGSPMTSAKTCVVLAAFALLQGSPSSAEWWNNAVKASLHENRGSILQEHKEQMFLRGKERSAAAKTGLFGSMWKMMGGNSKQGPVWESWCKEDFFKDQRDGGVAAVALDRMCHQ